MNPYDVLGISKEATQGDIKAAYKQAAQRAHPDKKEGGDATEYILIQEAYAILSDPQAKAHYDKTGETAGNTRTVVEQRLVTLFAYLLDESCDSGNLVHAAERAMSASNQSFVALLRKSEARLIRLRSLRTRVAAQARNLFTELIDGRIEEEIANIANYERELDINNAVVDMLADYSDNQGLPPC
ncbi:J domain-containing protein [Litorivivens sp.]|uniref:J domain-containing protein n=1 Tax=Litorivivens sp. TaxID=2020868 RepID=UPI0035684B59